MKQPHFIAEYLSFDQKLSSDRPFTQARFDPGILDYLFRVIELTSLGVNVYNRK